MNSSVSTVSTPKELQYVARSTPISQSFSSKANAAEFSLGRAQEESFDLQKEKLGVNIPNVDPSLDSLALHSSEVNIHTEVDAQTRIKHTDVEASKASMHVEVPQQNKESTPSSGQDGKSNAPGEGTVDFDVGTAATPLSRLRIWLIALCFSCFTLLGSYFLLAYWGSGKPWRTPGESKGGTIQEGVMLGQGIMHIDVSTVASLLSRLQLCITALCFSCLAFIGCYFILKYRGSRMPVVSFSPSLPISKDTVELKKDQISLLREAFARYPNLGGPREDFS